MNEVRRILALASTRNVMVLTGAGISAASGVPTFRGAGGIWRGYDAQVVASPECFAARPDLAWAFYHCRRQLLVDKIPNSAHYSLTALQQKLSVQGKKVHIVTQNVDRLHHAAGNDDVTEMHGSVWNLKRATDKDNFIDDGTGTHVWMDVTQPLVPAFATLPGLMSPEMETCEINIPVEELPHRAVGGGEGECELLRPAVVWFGEYLDQRVIEKINRIVMESDLLLVVGTSGVVYPAAGYAAAFTAAGKPVFHVNLEAASEIDISSSSGSSTILGSADDILPSMLGLEAETSALMERDELLRSGALNLPAFLQARLRKGE